MSDPAANPFTLRRLPLPAKLVVSTFLLAVGIGYFSALVQLHMQHSDRDGTPMPAVENVIAVFAGKRWQADDGTQPVVIGRLETLVSGSAKGELTAKNMAPAFFAHDGADYEKLAAANPAEVGKLDALREGERAAVLAWIRSAPEGRKQSYDDDSFVLHRTEAAKPITQGYVTQQPSVKIRSIITDRCARCHKAGGEKSDVPLQTYEDFAKYMTATVRVPEGGGWIDSGRQISLEKLTQSTHAHLLSFAVLFALTGLTFAFTSYPVLARCVLGPIVLIAQVADVSCWWLARLEPSGIYFAKTIIATGGVVGLGLGLQIVLSLFDMYALRGKLILLLLFVGAGALGGVAFEKVIGPYLEKERREKEELRVKPIPTEPPAPTTTAAHTGPTRLEQLLVWQRKMPDGTPITPANLLDKGFTLIPWKGKEGGNMARAFFDQDGATFKKDIKDGTPDEAKTLVEERDGERLVVLAWIRDTAESRKKAYADDVFTLPPALDNHPLTAEYKAGKTAKIRSILNDRCARCHMPGADKEDKLLDSYQALQKYLVPTAQPPK